MSRYVAYLGLGNIPLFLFKVAKETPTRLYGDVIERVDGRTDGWWYSTGLVHRREAGKSYVIKARCVEVQCLATWEQAKPVMKHAIEQKELELKRIDDMRRARRDAERDAEDAARLNCSERCLVELRKDG